MTQSISGLGSGLDTNAIVAQMVALERRSQSMVRARGTTASARLAAYDAIRAQVSAFKTATTGLARSIDWRPLAATTSNADAVTVSSGSGTFGGTLSFTVNTLAAAGSIRSGATVAATTTLVNADTAILVAAGGGKLGFSTFASDDALATGSHNIVVTQASAAATKNGDSALAASTVIDGTNNTLNVDVNGVAKVLTIASGTYDRTQLAAAVQAAADTAGAAVSVGVDQATNKLTLATNREGSLATLQVTGGNAVSPLVFSVDVGALLGTDGKTQVGTAGIETWSSIEAGGTAVLTAAAGTVTATFSGGLRTGTVAAKNVAVGDGSLAVVVANINAAGAGLVASAVQVGTNAYRLQIAANATGAGTGPNIAASEFGAGLGGFVDLSTATDAMITVGSGPGSYQVTSATNTVANLLPGITATLKTTTASAVTITASRDSGALADRVQKVVDAYNATKQAIDAATKYNAETKQASILTGDSVLRRILSEASRAISDAAPWATPGNASAAGVSVDRTGVYSFDRSKFTAAFDADPEGMTRLFVQGGSATDANVTFISAGDRTRAGTYDINITTAAAQASDVGLEGAWPIGAPPTVRAKIGTIEVSYAVQPGDLQADVVNGLNAAFATGGLALEASTSGIGIEIKTTQYGTSAHFEVAWDGSTWEPYAGTNVAGTIDGVAATGSGQLLSIAFDDATLGGLSLQIAGTATGALGTFTYEPGVAQRVSTAMFDATDAVAGYLTSSETTLKARVEFIDAQVESMEHRLELFETRLRRQFTALETSLSLLQSQSTWLSGQLAGLTGNQQ